VSGGERVARAVVPKVGDRAPELDAAMRSHPQPSLVYEAVTGDGPVLTLANATLALSLVPGRDGLAVTRGGATEYLTPDDLLSREAYDTGISIAGLGLNIGTDVPLVLAVLSERFGPPASDLWPEARFRRIPRAQ